MHPVYLLAIVTLVIVAAIGVWQLMSVKKSKANRGEASGSHNSVSRDPALSPTRAPGGQKPETVTPTRQ